jgi:hypothetical protein
MSIEAYKEQQKNDHNLRVKRAVLEMSDTDLMLNLETVLSDKQYKHDNYTAAMKNVVEFFKGMGNITPRQRNAVEQHLIKNSRFWF